MTKIKKEKFFNNYKKYFGTNSYKETLEKWNELSKEEKNYYKNLVLSETQKKWHSENKKYFSECMVGHKVSEKTKEKISKANKKYYKNSENKKKLSKKIKESFKKNPRSKETIEKQRESLIKTLNEHPEIKLKISESMKQWHKNNPGVTSEKTRIAMKEFYKTEKGQENLKKWTDGSRAKGTSILEKELQEFVKSIYSGEIIFNTRSILDGKELDIFIPDKKVAIEYNGNIWHSEAYKKDKAKTIHLEKTLLCEQKGIRLIHIFSDEWEFQQDIIKSLIASSLGIYKQKYFARKLQFREIGIVTARKFFNKNHIQGFTPAKNYYGLFDGNNLIQVASFGTNRFSKEKNIELVRMASLLNTQVLGGFSKLLKNANITTCESYVDRRLFNSAGYIATGWTKIGESGPRYFYTDGKKRENRQVYMKQSCLKKWPECDSSMTEHEMCLQHGLYRIYDCGTIKMGYKKI